ncbi:MAG: LapA family protein [Thermodesulfobacteriota bacterium]|nr:LapA family protein [Thermodesulfobacteriota bacterium]
MIKNSWNKNVKRVKIGIWVIIIGLLVLLVHQNQDFFLARQSLGLNLYFKTFALPEAANLFLFLICFLAGLLFAAYFIFFDRFKLKKTNKTLNTTINTHLEKISSLEKELETLKPTESKPFDPAVTLSTETKEPSDENSEKE